MASKKPVPLKDEPIYPTEEILRHIGRLTAVVNNLSNERQFIIKELKHNHAQKQKLYLLKPGKL